jgi:hypothetical protein
LLRLSSSENLVAACEINPADKLREHRFVSRGASQSSLNQFSVSRCHARSSRSRSWLRPGVSVSGRKRW